ncbi:MAG: hypothetical protein UV80_C0012G0004 [Candidatus Peregrinibacteria bacterium GW2011_GWF2_43_17]|nr:MAG: hypothetical protein UV80_C0012G0004 [Candidatus Peregrinibacteria bacterium GW2011_GWF2_43_17]HAU39529.1 hypothetical protein [Candidatus Peregrinibacteria bacterium]
MKTLKKIGVASCAKFYAVMLAVMYGFGGVIVTIVGLSVFVTGGGYYVLGGGIGILVIGVLAGLVIGYFAGGLCALIYNAIAGKIGGIQVELE